MKDYRSVWLYLHEVEHRLGYADVGGVRTRFLEAGNPDAPPLLLLHGTAGSIENFCANIQAYSEHFHVFAIDMLGCGRTDKPDYPYLVTSYAQHARDFLDVMGIGEADIVGVSLGSWVGARMALDFPGRVKRLVMVAPAGIVVDPNRVKEFVAGMQKRRMAAAGDPTWDSITTVFKNLVLKEEDIIDDLVAIRLSIYSNPEMKRAMPHLLAASQGEFRLTDNEWASLTTPILVVAAIDKDDIFLANARRIGELAPTSHVVEIPNCDHWAQFEQPWVFNRLSIAFLNGEPIPARIERSDTV